MKKALASVSVVGLLGAAGFVAWSVFSRPADDSVAKEQARAFDLQQVEAPPAARPTPPAESVRDAVAEPVSPRPIPLETMVVPGRVAREARRPAPPPVLPKAEAWARHTKAFAAMLNAPAGLIRSASAFRDARTLKGFLADPRAVDAFMDSALTRVTLKSPAIARAVIGSPTLVRAVLSSPAMRDPAAVRALLSSRMLAKILDCPAVQEALSDPAALRGSLADPETVRWFGENPQALQSLAKAAPALADAFAARR